MRKLRRQLSQCRQPLLVAQLALHLQQDLIELLERFVFALQIPSRRQNVVRQSRVEAANLFIGFREPIEHCVKAMRQLANLVGLPKSDPSLKVALLDLTHGLRQL
jgi:hypothetical protein